ncbi:hypothetical protein SBRCBS47491_007994 [Sporothrix bragantina]|uniref:Major facilitator superfamily (MFS) profile domain-containing protein n=1 Tax=Sporothrix bragantina TaxID=671064 RepID=A0ABP0CIA9_9PEZI
MQALSLPTGETPEKPMFEDAIHTASDEIPVQASSDRDETNTLSRDAIYTCCVIAGAFLILLLNSLQMTVVSSLSPYVTSNFGEHSLLPVISIVSSIVTGVMQLPISRVIDLYGRPQGLLAMVTLDVLGLVVMATCTTVKAYAAAQVLYYVGADGVIYIIRVFAMDRVAVRSRSMVYGASLYTYFVSPFVGPTLAQAYYKAGIWRWGFGSLAIIIPGVAFTLVFLFLWYEKRHPQPVRPGIKPQPAQPVHSSPFKAIWFHILDLDVLGVLLACFGIALVLLPLSLTTNRVQEWKSGSTIAMMVMGVVCLIALVTYERLITTRHFVDFSLLRDRLHPLSKFTASSSTPSLWWSYYTSFLQVVHYRSIRDAGYILNTHQVGSAFFSVLTGFLLRYTRRFRSVNLVGVAITTLGTGLMVHYSYPDSNFGGVVGCHILIAISSGILTASEVAAVLNGRDDGSVSMRVALLFVFSYIGAAIGSTIATPVWRTRFPHLLSKYLPAELQDQANTIFGSLTVQLSYARGTPAREAIIRAMCETWRYLIIASIATLALAWDANSSEAVSP